ncbi:diaminobutanoate acetyltransferase [Arcobacter venerupis]|uniref:L-2,4-diaminobutyric acid acetyltransferase n=1 Tax=Arcobacter venerupis TaxID=1054033 RepID=A0AAE7BCM2_9BACT|nr:diaminobutyrate acetyltransferase [Arcobacter venerupis]QKF67805.1 diaminobutanoate acetyltransferase [Arcobacter venerupis]RWS49413.1 diaminobutyrate acetyltransferase [Arcobacter venerupis]
MNSSILFRKPQKNDAKEIVNLIQSSGTLDLNSEYLYLLQSTHFNETCSVAVYNNEIIGFVSGYLVPNEEEKLFIWQVAVSSKFRGQNLALKIIIDIFNRNKSKKVIKYILSTVSPSNKSSQRVFEKVANHLNTKIKNKTLFSIDDFIDSHEEEVQYSIGPIEFNK